jgi:gas vesicle protein
MKPTSIASLFAGAIAGVAAMYLLDPQQGERRRRVIASKAGEYWDEAADAVGGQWHHLADYAKDAGQHAYSAAQSYANDLMGHASKAAGDARSRADDARSQAVSQAQNWIDEGRQRLNSYRDQAMKSVPSSSDVRDAAHNYGQAAWDQARRIGWRAHNRAVDALNRGRKAIGPRQLSPVIPVAITAASFCALGAGVMYVVDPQKGRARRAWIRDKVSSVVRRSGNTAYNKGRHLANRAYGVAAEARGAAGDLVEHVNAAISRVLKDPTVIKVMADVNGRITVAGKVMADQIDRLLSAIHSVPGVSEVINRIEAIAGQAQESSSTQGVH